MDSSVNALIDTFSKVLELVTYCARAPACLGTALHSTSVHDYNTIRPSGDLHCSYNLPGISYSV